MKKETLPTDTNQSESEILAKGILSLVDLSKTFSDILNKLPYADLTDLLLAKVGDKNPTDVVLLCDVRLVAKSGEVVRVFGENSLPAALDPGMLAESQANFERLLETVLIKPLLLGFQNHITKLVTEDENRTPQLSHNGLANESTGEHLFE